MPAMHRELVVSLADLRYITIHCPLCKTKVILDMEEPPAFTQKRDSFAPKRCAGCEGLYDSAIVPAVNSLQHSYQSLRAIADRISFRGEADIAELSRTNP
jgi:hypothetical protein